MSGRRRSSDHDHDRESQAEASSERAPAAELDEQALLGNQAVVSRLGSDVSVDDPLALARDSALPLVDRASLALEIESVGADRLARFEAILGASALDPAQRDAVLGRLQSDAWTADQVSAAVEGVFGADSEAVRDAVGASLDAVMDGLRNGSPAEGAWQLPDGQTVEVSGEGSRTQALVASVGDALGPAAGSSSATGARILAFCQRVQLALMLDEEEEEIGPDYGTEEVEG